MKNGSKVYWLSGDNFGGNLNFDVNTYDVIRGFFEKISSLPFQYQSYVKPSCL